MILVTTSVEESAHPYVQALRAVGFRDEEIAVVGPERRAEVGTLAENAFGVLLTGGCDVEPSRYGEETLVDRGVQTIPERDDLEWTVLDAARERRLPVWGVCRGLQVINVYFDGSLWQDLPSQLGSDLSHVPPARDTPPAALAHHVRVEAPESAFARRLRRAEAEAFEVNSRHHQAIKALGTGLRAVAYSPDDLIEAVELDGAESDEWWLRAVQWHPENLIDLPDHLALWEGFAAAVRRRAEEAP